MEKTGLKIIFLIFALIVFVVGGFCQESTQIPDEETITEDLNIKDRLLFEAIFEECNISVAEEMFTEDLEFYHDKWGIVANNRSQFIENIQSVCDAQKVGNSNQAKRKVDQRSIEIYPIQHFGAIQSGIHHFYQLIDGDYRYTESAKFTHLWKFQDGDWKLARVLSFDHKTIEGFSSE